MTTADEQRCQPRVQVLPPEQARRRARRLARAGELVVHGVPDEEWVAFQQALAQR